jgi:triosephosphate isomerase
MIYLPLYYTYMRKKIAAGNWKMNTTPEEGKQLVSKIIDHSPDLHTHQEVIFFPPFTHIASIAGTTSKKSFYTGAQNCSQYEKGAYTGEISIAMLKAIQATHVIIGHSERRSIFGESFEVLKEKSSAVIEAGLTLVFCCGETLEERENEQHYHVIDRQLQGSLTHLNKEDMKNVVIAYEPVWAIGTGKTASPEQAQDMHAYIRALLAEYFNETTAQATSILYGGSVNAANAKELFSQADIDGGLVGGASLKAEEFIEIIKALP